MKRKVQAQRKFAQGAYIPPSPAPPVPLERRADLTPCKDENKNIFYNNMSANDILNVVAFQKMHSHSEPVVVLERLHQIQDRLREQATCAALTPAPRRPKPRASATKAPLVGVAAPTFRKDRPIKKKVRTKRGASPVSEDDQPLNVVAQALQRDVSPPRTKCKGPAKSQLRGLRTRPAPLRRPIRLPKSLRRPSIADSQYSWRPANMRRGLFQMPEEAFTVQLRQYRPRRCVLTPDWTLRKYNYSRNSPLRQRSNDRVASPVRRLSPRSKRSSRSSDSIANSESPGPSTPSQSSRSTTPSWVPYVRKSIKVKRKRENVQAKKTTPLGKGGPRKAGARPAAQHSSAKQNSAKKQKTLEGEAIPASQDHDSESKAPPINGEAINSTDLFERCEGWLRNCKANPPDDVEQDRINFKVPRVPARKKEPVKNQPTETTPTLSVNVPVSSKSIQPRPTPITSSKGPDRSRITRSLVPNTRESKKQDCPSILFKTVHSIVNANDHELRTRCKVCKYCCRVDKILQLSHLVHKAAPADVPTEAVDVYDFSSEKDEAPQLLNYRQNRKLRSDVLVVKSPPAAESPAQVKVPTNGPLKQAILPLITLKSQAPALATTSKTVPASPGPAVVVTKNIQIAPPLSTSLRSSQRHLSFLTPKRLKMPPKPSVILSARKQLIAEYGLNTSKPNRSRKSSESTQKTIPPDASQLKETSQVRDNRLLSSGTTSGPQYASSPGLIQAQAHIPGSSDPAPESPGASNQAKESLEQIMQRLNTPIYVDFFGPEYPRVIMISTVALDNNPTKPILKARLVSRESNNARNEISLLENDNLVDELLSSWPCLFEGDAVGKIKSRTEDLGKESKVLLNKTEGHSNAPNNDSAEACKDGAGKKTDASYKPNVVINEKSMHPSQLTTSPPKVSPCPPPVVTVLPQGHTHLTVDVIVEVSDDIKCEDEQPEDFTSEPEELLYYYETDDSTYEPNKQTTPEEKSQIEDFSCLPEEPPLSPEEPPLSPEEPPLSPEEPRCPPKSCRKEVIANVHFEKEKPAAEPSTSKRAGDNKKTLSAPLDIFREAPSFYPTEEEFVMQSTSPQKVSTCPPLEVTVLPQGQTSSTVDDIIYVPEDIKHEDAQSEDSTCELEEPLYYDEPDDSPNEQTKPEEKTEREEPRCPPKSCRIKFIADVRFEKEKPAAEPATSKRAGDNKKTLSAPLEIFREAPSFYPTEEEFVDPIAYFEKIYNCAASYGVCKVVAPASFRPSCILTDDVRFVVANQYIGRLFNRWGPATHEMCAIKAYLAEQKVFFSRPPLIDGIELNLPKLYHTVQRYGGLKKVIEKKRWAKVAEDMRFPRGPRFASRIDHLYVKHLLPYDTLSNEERSELMKKVEKSWKRSYDHMLRRASNPLHRQKRLLGESDSSDDSDTEEDPNLASAIAEAEDCVASGRLVKLSAFQKVADNAVNTLFGQPEQATPEAVEQQYWELVANGNEHVCVNSASIDTGEGYGFATSKLDPNSRHPWNLKMLSQNEGNVLRSLGPVLGVTVPTLHLGMVYSTSCWHRDPHRLPWIEYMHQGPAKIWYGMADEQGGRFRKAVEEICPTSCQNKSMWLPSDITMIPPDMLQAHNIKLSRVLQKPGEFIIVLPKAYSSSISTGYTQSESVYFATSAWLDEVESVFKELRLNCEPTMFSLEQLLLAVAQDERTSPALLRRVQPTLAATVADELAHRTRLRRLGVCFSSPEYPPGSSRKKRPGGAWNVREQDECNVCRTTLYLSKVTGLVSKKSSFCPEHAVRLIEKRAQETSDWLDEVTVTEFVTVGDLTYALKLVADRLCEDE